MTTPRTKPTAKADGAAAGGNSTKAQRREREAAARRTMAEAQRRAARRRRLIRWGAGAVLAVLVVGGLYLIFNANNDRQPEAGSGSGYAYQVGDPGPGRPAPEFTLPSTAGEQVSLADFRGRSVLLYFHEGGLCQACFDQIRDLEAEWDKLAAAGVDELVTITVEPVDILAQNMRDDDLTSIALSDPDLAVSRMYSAEQYGMMGGTTPGHTFLLVDPDGTIRWRADYGGAPDFTMYLPVDAILADLRAGTGQAA